MPRDTTPLLLGAGAVGLLLVAAAVSPPGRKATRRLEDTVSETITDWIPTLLRKTSAHEGTWWSVQKNLDGNGVSYGILQWTQKSGALGRLLSAMHQADAAAFASFFGPSWARVLDVTARASMEPVDGAPLWAEPWAARFAAAGRHLAFQHAQAAEAARGEHMRAAIEIAQLLGVTTERALVLTFNRTVHQGAHGAMKPARALVGWYAEDIRRRPERANDVLAQYAWSCASRFRRTSAPGHRCFNNDCNILWSLVTSEYSELQADGAYAVRRVPVQGVWHAVTGPGSKPWSLYDLIVKRSSDILTDPELRDLPVDLGGRAAA